MADERIIENEHIRCVLRPLDGGRLVSFIDKASGREYIWTNKRTEHISRYYGANYDDVCAGGVEEAFPTGLADEFHTDKLPFFGEFWSVPWRIQNQSENMLELSCYSAIYPIHLTKTYQLEGQSLSCGYLLQNEGPNEIPYLLGIHPSLNIKADDKLRLPPGEYHVGTAVNVPHALGKTFTWPLLNGRDLGIVASDHQSGECLEFRSHPLREGYIELLDQNKVFRVEFDPAYFPALSVWLIYGGWRGHYCIMTEFFTGWPFLLSEAIAKGKHTKIKAGETVSTAVTYRLYQHAGEINEHTNP